MWSGQCQPLPPLLGLNSLGSWPPETLPSSPLRLEEGQDSGLCYQRGSGPCPGVKALRTAVFTEDLTDARGREKRMFSVTVGVTGKGHPVPLCEVTVDLQLWPRQLQYG